jgi:hypothetical protein
MRLLERPRREGTAENLLGALLELVVISFGTKKRAQNYSNSPRNVNKKLK